LLRLKSAADDARAAGRAGIDPQALTDLISGRPWLPAIN
jgi:hypothetical protein